MGKDNITRKLPVLIGNNQHVMAIAEIKREPNRLSIEIESAGPESQYLADFLEQGTPIALSFVVIPVQSAQEKRDNI